LIRSGGRAETLEQLLDAAGLKHPCDLDLLLFFDRHPDALMTSEQLASYVGYELSQIARSLDLLVQRQVLRRSQTLTHFSRLYRFRADHAGEVLEILKAATTVEERYQMRRILRQRQMPPTTTSPLPDDAGSEKQENSHA
jgi:DNA-binding MarR family transcriptional regulator